jgi:hypothetical protein
VNGSAVTTAPAQTISDVHGQLIRFKFLLSISGGTTIEVGAVTFDLHSTLDHA